MKSLANVVQQIRDQRQPFAEIKILLEGEVESEQILQSMCIIDELANPSYKVDFNKFMLKVQQAAAQGGLGVAQSPVGMSGA
jgi:hypothetical protein